MVDMSFEEDIRTILSYFKVESICIIVPVLFCVFVCLVVCPYAFYLLGNWMLCVCQFVF